MFYKRISDLHPLGQPNGTDWDNIVDISDILYQIESNPSSVNYHGLDVQESKSLDIPTSFLTGLAASYNSTKWWKELSKTMSCNFISKKKLSDEDSEIVSSEYYPPAMWVEASIAKGDDNKPTSGTPKKYQSKRMNLNNITNNGIDKISMDVLSVDIFESNDLSVGTILSKFFTGKEVSSDSIQTKVIDANEISVDSITANAISALHGRIDCISGDELYFNNTKLSKMYSTEITATNGKITNITSTTITSQNGTFTNVHVFNDMTVDKNAIMPSIFVEEENVSELFEANSTYLSNLTSYVQGNPRFDAGSLIRFGKASDGNVPWEITLAGPNDIPNGVVGWKSGSFISSGIVLDECDSSELSTKLSVVLYGRARVKVKENPSHQLAKYDKLIMSDTLGLATNVISTTQPVIGIVLDADRSAVLWDNSIFVKAAIVKFNVN